VREQHPESGEEAMAVVEDRSKSLMSLGNKWEEEDGLLDLKYYLKGEVWFHRLIGYSYMS
jgi:hypothetical protein